MSQRLHLLSALAALSLGGTPALADQALIDTAPGAEQLVVVPLDITGQISRMAAILGSLDAELAERLRDCLQDLQHANLEPVTAEDAIWRSARGMECMAALQLAQAQVGQSEIY